ncbi:MAG: hypothetical protein M0036_16845 [Desulfobacteraceae bacterium]|nr:hypothetical protein [Desulfobacteraceae bacterium]
MANLQIKNIDDQFYHQIKTMAEAEHRSISQQVLYLVKEYLAKQKGLPKIKTPAQALLDLSGSWDDGQDADSIIAGIKRQRSNSKKLSKGI